jgi:hypothetical protein
MNWLTKKAAIAKQNEESPRKADELTADLLYIFIGLIFYTSLNGQVIWERSANRGRKKECTDFAYLPELLTKAILLLSGDHDGTLIFLGLNEYRYQQ